MSYMNKMKGKFLEVSFRIIAANLRYLMIVDLLDQLKRERVPVEGERQSRRYFSRQLWTNEG
ncbi:hypothetical protein DMI66_10650 [Escherichia coli]|nr:hypothetical protein [Escherichia coli]